MDTFEEIVATTNYHFDQASREVKRSAFWATLFKWGIPILSAIVTAVLAGKLMIGEVNLEVTGVWLSLLVTIMTVANSVARPGQAFRDAAMYANKFRAFGIALKVGMDRIRNTSAQEHEKNKAVSDYLDEKNKELAQLISDYNGAFIPSQPDKGPDSNRGRD